MSSYHATACHLIAFACTRVWMDGSGGSSSGSTLNLLRYTSQDTKLLLAMQRPLSIFSLENE